MIIPERNNAALPVYDPAVCLANVIPLHATSILPDAEDFAMRYAGPQLLENPEDADAEQVRARQMRLVRPVSSWLDHYNNQPFRSEIDAVGLLGESQATLDRWGSHIARLGQKHGASTTQRSEAPFYPKSALSRTWSVRSSPMGNYMVVTPDPRGDTSSRIFTDLDALHRADPEVMAELMARYHLLGTQQTLATNALTGLAAHRLPLTDFVPPFYDRILNTFDKNTDRTANQQLHQILRHLVELPLWATSSSPRFGNILNEGLDKLDTVTVETTVSESPVRLKPSLYLDHRARCPAEEPESREHVGRYERLHETLVSAVSTHRTQFPDSTLALLGRIVSLSTDTPGIDALMRDTGLWQGDISLVSELRGPGSAYTNPENLHQVATAGLGLLIIQRQHNISTAVPGVREILGHLQPTGLSFVPKFRLGRLFNYLQDTAPATS